MSSSEAGIMIVFWVVYTLFLFALVGVLMVSKWKLHEKAGKPGWSAIVPIYNTIVTLEMVGKPITWLFLMMIPFAGIIWQIKTLDLLAKSFGKDTMWTLGLLFVPLLTYPMMAFSKNIKYVGPAGAEGFDPNARPIETEDDFLKPGDIR